MIRVVIVMVFACGDNLPPDDGFGEPCESVADGRMFTTCETSTGAEGICAVDVCRRWCDGERCPLGQRAVPTVAQRCWCEP
jgi:hypothetical protein